MQQSFEDAEFVDSHDYACLCLCRISCLFPRGVWCLNCFWIVQEHIDQYIAKQAGIRADSANAT